MYRAAPAAAAGAAEQPAVAVGLAQDHGWSLKTWLLVRRPRVKTNNQTTAAVVTRTGFGFRSGAPTD